VGYGDEPGKLIIEHEEIPGYMPAMTMTFTAKDTVKTKDFSINEAINFTYYVKPDQSYIDNISHLPDTAVNPAGFIAEQPELELLSGERVRTEGETISAVTLNNQNNDSVTLPVSSRRYTLFTFIYTRCPIPDFCPLMSKRFNEIHKRLNEIEPDLLLVSVSFDTKYDTPNVLKDYGRRYTDSFKDWQFVSGSPEQVGRLSSELGVVTQTESNQIIHNLRTVLISDSGRILKIWRGNEWTANDVILYMNSKI
jgi:protein SCO1/2